jgi:hypothetical protein
MPARQPRVAEHTLRIVGGGGVVQQCAQVGAPQQELRQDPIGVGDSRVDRRRERGDRFVEAPLILPRVRQT